MSLTDLIDSAWPGVTTTPLSKLDIALAQYCHSVQASSDIRHRWLAALVSHQWGRGHACLDLTALQQQPEDLLGWTTQEVQRLPTGCAAAADSLPWTQGEN
jgi:exodeoxyribonuclease V alpha subunit